MFLLDLILQVFFPVLLAVVQIAAGTFWGGQANAVDSIAANPRYAVRLVQRNIPESQVPTPLRYDFDGDGIADTVSRYPFYFYGINITLSSTGKKVSIASGPKGFNGVSAISFNADGSYPSLVFATYTYSMRQPTGFDYAKQVIAINDHGIFTIKKLPLSVIGRDVSCTDHFPEQSDPVCFFASYFDYVGKKGPSKLVAIHPDGTVTDITKKAGLPFPVAPYGNGSWMIGSVFSNFDGNAMPDLLAVGQHRQILTAFSRANGTMGYRWAGEGWDYMRPFVPSLAEMDFNQMPPCVYMAMERGKGHPDYMMCYEKSTKQWYSLKLPVTSWSYSRGVHFWMQNGMVVFSAEGAGGNVNLFSLAKPGSGTIQAAEDFEAVPQYDLDAGPDAAIDAGATPTGDASAPRDIPQTIADPEL